MDLAHGRYWNVSWSPILGCTGCGSAGPHGERCWARRQAARGLCDAHHGLATREGWTGEVRFREEVLAAPLHWRKPRVVYVCLMGDLFHERVPDEWIDRVYAVMALCSQHTFITLTKRWEAQARYFAGKNLLDRLGWAEARIAQIEGCVSFAGNWPLPNVILGASAWDQPSADEAWRWLSQTPAAYRWLSLEPMLVPVDLASVLGGYLVPRHDGSGMNTWANPDWIVCGPETGPRAHPCNWLWIHDVVSGCQAAGVPVWVKALMDHNGRRLPFELWPQDLRVRQRPEVSR